MTLLLSAVGGLASGVFLRSLFAFGWEPIAFVLLLAALLGAAAFVKRRPAYSLGALCCIFIALGMLRTQHTDTPLSEPFASQIRHRVSYEGFVVSDPDVRDANQRVVIRIESGGQSTKALAIAPRFPTVAVGDRVRVSGTLLVPQPFMSENGRVFRYDKYLAREDVRFILNYASIRVESNAPWHSPSAALARAKHAFLGGLSATLPEPYSSLAGGIVIGGKTGLGKDLQEAFIRSGLVQIIVLSGYNVMVVAQWVVAALALTKLPRRWGIAAAACAVLLFVFIAGASATALRAMLMAFIALYARATGRSYAAGRALLVVVCLMLLWNPLYLVFDPGFDLSVVATAGLIWLAPRVEMLLSFLKNAFWRNAVATTLAAQIAVLPLLVYDMGLFSVIAVPANILVAPIVPLAMGLSALAGFAGMLFGTVAPFAGIALAFPAYLANAYLVLVAQKAAALPFAAFTLPIFPFWLVLVAYAALVFIASSKRFSMTDQLMLAKKASI